MATTTQLGPFEVELSEPIGQGGMGRVYRAEHERTGVKVAVKVVIGEADHEAREAFRREVQAHANLVHPNVVYLYEYGTVGGMDVAGSVDEFDPGSPFVAMEFADRGTVRDSMPATGWAQVRGWIVEVLDGLAFAHARGVVHRDLKPENLLVCADRKGGSRLKLADFGLAHALARSRKRETDRLESVAGTPYYVAPEQARARWRRYGPWTDLYALGCVVWEWVCGRPPFTAADPMALLFQHVTEPPPELEPQFPVPEDLGDWVRRAMAIEPEGRFRRAADALRTLPPAEEPVPVDAGADERRAPDAYDGATDDTLAQTLAQVEREARPYRAPPDSDERGATSDTERLEPKPTLVDEPPAPGADEELQERSERRESNDGPRVHVPPTWRVPDGDALPTPMVDTGLGLFDLREPPFVDRDRLRTRIWEALREVDRCAEARAVVLVGESGAGKSRLAEWMATRAHALGAARVFRVVHERGEGSPISGVSGMVRRAVRGWKLDRGEFYEYLVEHLPRLPEEESVERDARPLCELVYPTGDGADDVDGPPHRFSGPAEVRALIDRFVRRMARGRPPLVWIDDAQWGRRAVDWTEHVFERSVDSTPALLLLTVRSDELIDRPDLADRIDSISQDDRCHRSDVMPLENVDQRELIERMLPLSEELSRTITDRTEGNPLFATQLLGELVVRGELEATPQGFSLPGATSADLPADVHELWMRRLRQLVDGLEASKPKTVWRALERAAALGREVRADEWSALARQVGLNESADLRNALIDRALAERTDAGWSFAHGMLIESLERRARKARRWRGHHRRCVELLEEVYPEQRDANAGRRARHLERAGELEEAIEARWRQGEFLRRRGDHEGALEALERRRTSLEELGVPAEDARVIENEIFTARGRLPAGASPQEVEAVLEAAIERARDRGLDRLLSRAHQTAAKMHRTAGRMQRARSHARRAVEAARGGPAGVLQEALHRSSWVHFFGGDFETARQRAKEGLEIARDRDDAFATAQALRALAGAVEALGDPDRADDLAKRSLDLSCEHGFRAGEAMSLNQLGEFARFQGDSERAREYYRRYEEMIRGRMLEGEAVAVLNLAQVELMARNFERAIERLDEGERKLERISRKEGRAHTLRLGRMAAASGMRDWERFDEFFEHYADGWPDDAHLIRDHALLLEMAGSPAAEAGANERAERTWSLALVLYERLDDDEAAARLDERLSDLRR